MASWRLGEELADVVEHAGVGGWIRPRGAPDGGLVDVDHLVEELDALDLAVPARERLGPVQLLGQGAQEDVVDQGRLARARDAGHRHQPAQRERDVDVVQVVLAGTAHRERRPRCRAVGVTGPGWIACPRGTAR